MLMIFSVLMLSSCGQNLTGDATNAPEVRIGVLASITGTGSYHGQQELRGLELAKAVLNEKGGIAGRKIQLIVEDTKTDQATAVTSLSKLADVDGIRFIVGDSWSTTTEAIISSANQRGILLISPIAPQDSMSEDDLFFRTIPTVREMMIPLAKYAIEEAESKNVGIINNQNQFGKEHADDFAAAFKGMGGRISGREELGPTELDARSALIKIKEGNPDTILDFHNSGLVGIVLKQADELGINAVWLGTFGAETAPLLRDYGTYAEGLIYPYSYDPSSTLPSVKEFVDMYQSRYNETPDNTAANSYDALIVLAKAIEEAGEDPYKVKTAILEFKDFPGASGIFSFDKNGDVKKKIIIKRVKDGKFVKVES